MGLHRPTADQRRTGLAAIAAIRETLKSAPKPVDPFRHDHEPGQPCPVCGTLFEAEISEPVRHLRSA